MERPLHFLFCPWPTLGDLYPLLAVAVQLRDRGHDVRFLCSERVDRVLSDCGFMRYPGPEFPAEPARLGPGAGGKRFLLDPLPAEVASLRSAIDEFGPDGIVDSILPFGPRLIAEVMTIPHASISVCSCPLPGRDLFPYGLGLPPARDAITRSLARAARDRQREQMMDELVQWNEFRQSLGLQPSDEHPWMSVPSEQLVLIPTTPAFEYQRSDLPRHAHFVGPLLWRAEGLSIPDVLANHDPAIPLIYVSQGTFLTDHYPILDLAFAALGSEPVTMAVSIGKDRLRPGDVARIPDNARTHRAFHLGELFARCSLAIVHGGFGTVSEAMHAGLPVIVLPMCSDQPEVAQRCVQAGVGLSLDLEQCSPERLREAVHEILRNPGYRDAAQRVSRSYRAHDGPLESARLLEQLARQGGPVIRDVTTEDAATATRHPLCSEELTR